MESFPDFEKSINKINILINSKLYHIYVLNRKSVQLHMFANIHNLLLPDLK